MTLYDLPNEQRLEATRRIEAIIGTKKSWIRDDMDLSTRIETRTRYNRLFEKLGKIYAEHGEKALAMNFTDHGGYKEGITPAGKKWILYMNNGWTTRSRHCGTLTIEGEGTIFTSGTLAKAFEYILNH